MASMSLDKEIKQYLPLLEVEQKESLLSQIKSFLNIKDAQPKLSRKEYLIQYNKEIDEAEREIEAGNYISQEDLEKESESW